MNEDNSLKSLLQDWKVHPKPHLGFGRGVWERIGAESTRLSPGIWAPIGRWFVVSLPKPAYACAFITLFALGGIAVADMHASSVQQRRNARMEQSYLASIDPVAMANAALRPRP